MPETYAHLAFGKQVLNYVDNDVKKIILENLPLYHIGVHGPDIFFYTKPFTPNHISKTGNELHAASADGFLLNAKKVITGCPKPEAAFSYIFGFISHYVLDSECHPYIRKFERKGLTHSDIETEFERELMLRDGINPLPYKLTGHILAEGEYAECISWFYDGISRDEVLLSLKSMKFYLNLLVSLRHTKWFLDNERFKKDDKLEYKIGLIMSRRPILECSEITPDLCRMFSDSVMVAADLINEYYKNIKSNEINSRFLRNFG
jgi:hypothetical protein